MISTKLATHIVGCIPHIVCHISGTHLLLYPHDCWFNPHFFPTSLCGVLVFDSVSRLLPLSHNNFVTHHLSHTTLSHIIFHTQLCHTHTRCHTSSFTRTFVTKQLCHTSSFTHNFVTHLLSRTTLSHIIFHFVTSIFVLRGTCGTYGIGLALVARLGTRLGALGRR